MEDRIKIGDEWYVKESSIQTDKDVSLIKLEEIITYKGSVWENEDFCFEASHDIDTGELDIITFTDKRNQEFPYTELQYWDNELWFKRVLDLDEGVFEEFDEGDELLINSIKEFINHVYNIYT